MIEQCFDNIIVAIYFIKYSNPRISLVTTLRNDRNPFSNC
jgi:hypothetical protein